MAVESEIAALVDFLQKLIFSKGNCLTEFIDFYREESAANSLLLRLLYTDIYSTTASLKCHRFLSLQNG